MCGDARQINAVRGGQKAPRCRKNGVGREDFGAKMVFICEEKANFAPVFDIDKLNGLDIDKQKSVPRVARQ